MITDTPGVREVCHQQLTSENIFIRFVGNSLHLTDFSRLDQWAERVGDLISRKRTIAFFIHQPIEGDGVALTKHFQTKLRPYNDLLVHQYIGYNKKQLSLFD